MLLSEKLEILIKRNGYKKSDFASAVGITYRALANYISGARSPRPKIVSDMAILLGVDSEVLLNDDITITLTSDEKLYFNGSSPEEVLDSAHGLLCEIEKLLSREDFEQQDKTAFFNCVAEKYFSSKKKI